MRIYLVFILAMLLGIVIGAECVIINTHRHGLNQVPHTWQSWK